MQDKFIEKIDQILKKHLTPNSFDLWIGICEKISNNCWKKPTSSTKKYHRKEDEGGRVGSVSEHTWEMIYAADKLVRMFDGIINKDVIFLSIALHDSYKYGLVKSCKFTETKHDHIIAEIIKKNRNIFKQALSDNDINLLENAVRFHSGKWSTDADKNFGIDNFTAEVMFLHILDMMSSQNLIKVLEDKK